MTYEEALDYLRGLGRWGVKLDHDRMWAMLGELDRPDRGLRGALVAGTNGKGSVCAMLASILGAAGLRCGQMPSPHLSSYTERIMIDASPISEADLAAAVTRFRRLLGPVIEVHGHPTEFEIVTAMAINHLAPRVDRLICEVGLGGLLDATNVLDLGVAVVTNVSLDHQRYLGDTVEEIAVNKAGIIKAGNRVVTGAQGVALGVVEAAAGRAGAELWRLGRELEIEVDSLGWRGSRLDVRGPGFEHLGLHVPLLGRFQAENAALAVAAAHAGDEVSSRAVAAGLAAARWPGRLESVAESPRVVLDGAHNQDGMERLVDAVRLLLGDEPVVVVFGAMADHDPAILLDRLRPLEPRSVVCVTVTSERAASAESLAEAWGSGAGAIALPAAGLARARELAGPDGNVLVCGSLYLVGELRPLTGVS